MATHRSYYQYIILFVVLACSCKPGRAGPPLAKDGCRESCGNLTIPFPFGVSEHCYLEEKFLITCNESTGTPQAYLRTSEIEVSNISLYDGELQVLNYRGKKCYYKNGSLDEHEDRSPSPSIWLSSFTLSPTRNKFVAIGCDTYAIVEGYTHNDDYDDDDPSYTTGCMSICKEYDYGSCSGVGCCEITNIPRGLGKIVVTMNSYDGHKKVWDFDRCSYAFVVEDSWFKFSKTSFQQLNTRENVPMIIDWSIGNKSCEEARRWGNLLCNENNSSCVDSSTGSGYICECKRGYEGNPYHPEGCQDIDECNDPSYCNPGTCHNTPGSFTCSCGKGYTQNDTVCTKVIKESGRYSTIIVVIISLSISIGLIVVSSMFIWGMRKRKLIKLKEKFFEQNGGLMLKRRLSTEHGASVETTRIFSAEELKSATNNYEKNRVVGEGGYGVVYKGILAENRVVAIKKPRSIGNQNVDPGQFINELVVLMQINHRNVVSLLGCCLETEAPLLVYEFITNGTLFEHLHNRDPESKSFLSWEVRLKIAAETAGALAYLHAETSVQIIHRDVKTMNILLDENYTAKVSDFGTSKLVPLDQEEFSTFVQGTRGYLDPEYMQSSMLTEKSDVYSFGVVLAELITGKKALTFNKSVGASNLAMSFVHLMQADQLLQLIDDAILDDTNMEAIKEVAILTKRCLCLKGEDRPTMKEVAMELEGLRIMTRKHPWGKDGDVMHSEETEHLLGPPSIPLALDIESGSSSITTAGYDSMQTQLVLIPHNNDGR
ncbi:hypothetical protein UlMin_027292 [Ulmus minor]